MPKKPKNRRLRVLLLKEEIASFEDALKAPHELVEYKLKDDIGFEGKFYIKGQRTNVPSWVDFIEEGLDLSLATINTKSVAAVLFVKIEHKGKKRILAYTFGHGDSLLKSDTYEYKFGLKVALNRIDPGSWRELDVRRIEEFTKHTFQHASRGTSIESFELDENLDLVREVSGKPKAEFKDFAKKFTGSDALKIHVPIVFPSLREKSEEILKASEELTYRERFGFIDNYGEVKDKILKNELDLHLVEKIRAGETDRMHLAMPKPIDTDLFEGFRYTSRGETQFDLDIDFWTENVLKNRDTMEPKDLKSRYVHVVWHAGATTQQWSIYECLVFETEYRGSYYVLSGGQWYEINRNYLDEIIEYITPLACTTLSLPPAESGWIESKYNTFVAENRPEIINLDDVKFPVAEHPNKIEFCDLLTLDKQLVYVKRKTRSSTLSHLFAQGYVSAGLLRDYEKFRLKVRTHIEGLSTQHAALIAPNNQVTPQGFEIIFAIIAKPRKSWPYWLPFFSRLHLREKTKSIKRLGYKVSVLLVEQS